MSDKQESNHNVVGALRAYRKTITFDMLSIVKLDVPSGGRYSHAILNAENENVGYLEWITDNKYRIILHSGYEYREKTINLPQDGNFKLEQ